MTDMSTLRAEAAAARAAAATGQQARAALPCGEAMREDVKFRSEFRGELVTVGGTEFYRVEGYASTSEQPYEMWDQFGPYHEVVSRDAFDRTLAGDPMVVFRFNHAGTPMATTRNDRLQLAADENGLNVRAHINPKRADVADLITAIEDRDVTEQSFMFMITNGEWSEDFTEFRIREVDLDRGDVGPVTYGANPYTSIAARAGEFLSVIPDMPVLAAREAMHRLRQRADIGEPKVEVHMDAEKLTDALVSVREAREKEYPHSKTPDAPEGPVGTSIRLRLAQLEVDKQHDQ